jgi:hypothetical protein
MASLADQIRSQIERCTSGKSSLDEFRMWFVPLARNIEQSQHAEAIKLAYRIEGILGEASSGNWTDQELMEELTQIGLPFAPSSVEKWDVPPVEELPPVQWSGPSAPKELLKLGFGANNSGIPFQPQRAGSNAACGPTREAA